MSQRESDIGTNGLIPPPSFRGVIGVIATLERFLTTAEQRASQFFIHTLRKQLTRLRNIFDRHIVSLCHVYHRMMRVLTMFNIIEAAN